MWDKPHLNPEDLYVYSSYAYGFNGIFPHVRFPEGWRKLAFTVAISPRYGALGGESFKVQGGVDISFLTGHEVGVTGVWQVRGFWARCSA